MRKFLFVFLLGSGMLYAQEADSLLTDSIPPLPEHETGFFAIGGIDLLPNPGGHNIAGNAGLGIKYDRFRFIYSVSFFLGEYERRLIFPNQFSLNYQYWGVTLIYALMDKEKMNIGPFASVQFGDMIWEFSDTGDDLFREKFTLTQFGADLEYDLSRYIKLGARAGYQFMSDPDLTGIEEGDFGGFFVGFNVKVGYFNQ